MALQFEWDPPKAERNLALHGVTFEEAATAFGDPLSITIDDPLHSVDEDRYILIGRSYRGHLLVIVHAERGSRIRIISARPSTAREGKGYEGS